MNLKGWPFESSNGVEPLGDGKGPGPGFPD